MESTQNNMINVCFYFSERNSNFRHVKASYLMGNTKHVKGFDPKNGYEISSAQLIPKGFTLIGRDL